MWAVGGVCGYGGFVGVMGEWAVDLWVVGVSIVREIYGLYSVEHHKVEKLWDFPFIGFGDPPSPPPKSDETHFCNKTDSFVSGPSPPPYLKI